MSGCGTCIRWRRRIRPANAPRNWRSRYGYCWAPPHGPAPYMEPEHRRDEIMTAEVHGEDCQARKEKKR